MMMATARAAVTVTADMASEVDTLKWVLGVGWLPAVVGTDYQLWDRKSPSLDNSCLESSG